MNRYIRLLFYVITIYYFFICVFRETECLRFSNKLNSDEDVILTLMSGFIRTRVELSESSGLVGSLGRRAI